MDREITARVILAQNNRFQAAFHVSPGKPAVLRWGHMPNLPDSPLGKLITNNGAAGSIPVILGFEGTSDMELVPLFIRDNGVNVPLYNSLADIR